MFQILQRPNGSAASMLLGLWQEELRRTEEAAAAKAQERLDQTLQEKDDEARRAAHAAAELERCEPRKKKGD